MCDGKNGFEKTKHNFPYKWTLKDAVFTKDKGKVFSCFACGGGSTMGYKLAGFDVLGCNEIDPKMIEAYKANHNPKYAYLEPIQTFKLRTDLPDELYNLDILDGSPPCSSFSMAGNREKDWGKDKVFREGQAMQVLDTLFFDFIDLAKKLQKLREKEGLKPSDRALHSVFIGPPGTGKTTYLRYLIGKIKKRVLFLSPNVAGNLMDPDFIEMLIDNPDTVLIIEDAENIIMDRRNSSDSSVSNLLNISDGLLADFLNVQIICTFNSSLTLVDSALMRKGRLIAKYEFGKLSVSKAQRLSNHLGFDTVITKPMTVAEISNQHEQNFDRKQVQVIGFRREELMQN